MSEDLLNLTDQDILNIKLEDFRNGIYWWLIPEHFETSYEAMDVLLNNDEVSDLLFGGAAAGGKSYTGWAWETFMCLAYPGINAVVVRDQLNDLRTMGMVSFKEIARHHNLIEKKHWHHDKGDNRILFDHTGKGDFGIASSVLWMKGVHVTEDDEEIQGLGSTLYAIAFIEEAGQVHSRVHDVLSHSRLGRCPMGNKYGILPMCFITCNPSENWTKHQFYTPWSKGVLPEYMMFINSVSTDNPFMDETYIKSQDKLSEYQRKRLRDGDWEFTEQGNMLCDQEAISDMFYNDFVKGGEKRLSSDIAMNGKDLFNIGYGNGHRYKIVLSLAKSDGPGVLSEIKKASTKYCVPRSKIVFDGDGLGNFLDGFLKASKKFNNNGKATKKGKEYANIKSQCAWKLRELVNNREIYVECDDPDMQERIIREFKCLREAGGDGKLRLISKDEMKQYNNKKSTDFLDVFIMFMYFEVYKTKAANTGIMEVRK